ncbi:MAG: SRPBCC domain-containing protein, partial [Proteobacteria bacterium]
MSHPLQVEQTYDVPIATVWAALTNESQMRRWYFPQLVRFEPVVGFDFEFENDGSAYQKAWRVTDVVEGTKLAHSWVYEGHPGDSEVTFELFDEGTRT